MNSLRLNQAGAAHLVAVFVVVFVGLVSFAGYKVVNMNQLEEPAPSVSKSSESVPVAISTPADLDKTAAVLDDDSSLNAGLNDQNLDDDLKDLL